MEQRTCFRHIEACVRGMNKECLTLFLFMSADQQTQEGEFILFSFMEVKRDRMSGNMTDTNLDLLCHDKIQSLLNKYGEICFKKYLCIYWLLFVKDHRSF